MAERLPEFLPQTQPADIFPGADRFGAPEGKPMVARVFQGEEPLGYVYVTTDVVNTRGYSSKPIDILVGVADDGTIKGAKLVEHHEPIVLIGIPQSKVDAFIGAYVGLNLIRSPAPDNQAPADIISGATVTLMVINDSIYRSMRTLSQQYGIGTATAGATANAAAGGASEAAATVQTRPHRLVNQEKADVQSWQALLNEGAIARLHMTVADVNKAFAAGGKAGAAAHPEKGADDDTFVDLYTALVSQPAIGKSLLGEAGWNDLQGRLKPGQQAVVVAGEGRYSFKGSGYVRGGIFDRIEVVQGDESFRFTDLNHQRLPAFDAAGAPHFKEIALFTVPEEVKFDAAEPWRLQLMIQRVLSVNDKAFVTADLNYQLPQPYTVDDPDGEPVAVAAAVTPPGTDAVAGAAAAAEGEPSSQLWKQIWQGKRWQIGVVALSLLILVAVFFFQDTLTKYPKFYDRFRLVYLTFSLFYIGWYAQAQLSVVNVLTFTTALRTGFSWEYFLMDPLVFILWCATAISILFWNRGAFCGWLCPFGSLQELLNRIAKKLGVKQIVVPHGVHTRMAALKYVIFMVLFGVSLYELGLAEKLSEVEPFKTAIILKFVREWWFVAFALVLLLAGLFIERFYCRYLCPLGAALAIPARLRVFDWLRRYPMCGNPCQRCAHDCPVQAIHPEGDIDPNECIQCLHCQMLYHHQTDCPHVVQVNKKKQKQAAAKAELDAQRRAQAQQEQVIHFVDKRPSEKPSDTAR
ncbi:NosR/NirI family protein [Uruburuella testudinis]|uniref:NosR/NirI family protein n=2 Tax=Uruburuella testudinis TaxID=1282863 RepID=A0ABY4DW01_9NEIS|nr:NosR/NirI family protein [Uruburuella testudinis]UOO83185.1 NosR/NirI family protein [Uruburuella testudinis]